MKNFPRYLGLILGITALVFVGIVCAIMILWVSDVGIYKISELIGWKYWLKDRYMEAYYEGLDNKITQEDYDVIIKWVVNCIGDKEDVDNIPYLHWGCSRPFLLA